MIACLVAAKLLFNMRDDAISSVSKKLKNNKEPHRTR
jgi:hypothetical protein